MKAYALLGGPEEEWPQNIKNDFALAQQKNDLLIGVDRSCPRMHRACGRIQSWGPLLIGLLNHLCF